MKLSLVVLTPGKTEGKVIPITLSQFVIGRDPQCHLRPASAVISKRHCALLLRESKVFVRDFESTNGTFVNDQQVKGEIELHHDDRLKVGPLLFNVRIEAAPAINRPTPPPPIKAAAPAAMDDEAAAAMLLASQDETGEAPNLGENKVPEGSTVMEVPVPQGEGKPAEGQAAEGQAAEGQDKAAEEAKKKNAQADASSSTAAKAILEKYMRRPRG